MMDQLLPQPASFDWDMIWNAKLIPKINVFWWVAVHGSILTIDNFIKRGYRIINRYSLWYEEE
jgi:hypothetical protein